MAIFTIYYSQPFVCKLFLFDINAANHNNKGKGIEHLATNDVRASNTS